ncbi:hypothetical protein V9T40_005475 [Parthenolecanium corni]|uniref:Coatomer subunit gamma n=1 Tax=Parthenolecanium corni TaxID=536013 RepID=A0AAN9Y332_9HEMI
MAFRRDKKEDEDGGNPFQNLDKTAILQEARTFNDTPVNPRKCTHILTKILYLINQGEQLGSLEATDAFFAMTKLFQSKDIILRRMVYLGIKELSKVAEDVIIVTSSLTKDMTGKEDTYRAAAIRALCSITDATMLQAIERYMKQAIVDRNPSVSSAALVSSLHMSRNAGDLVKRWVSEVQEALNSDNVMVQYHALGLMYHIRKSDRLAVTKLVARLTRSSLKSPFAVCMLIRLACKLLEEEGDGSSDNSLFEFIESCMRHKSETVVYEAVHAIVNLRRTTARELTPAVSVLQLFCTSPKPALRFAAVRTLNKVAMTHPSAIIACNVDLENLISDTNRSIATLAITTLLKTGSETSVDRLMKQISSFVNEISDEFKIVVVQAIRDLCEKFPRKHTVLMNFLSGMLRDEGGLDYKAAIADTIITIIEGNPEAKETGLAHLCEFIEDCEHSSLAVRILHLLGREGPRSKQPSRYIRFIYNRVLLECTVVRAAAISALAQFGATCPELLPDILVLLGRCQTDSDDEVRDRATYYYCILTLQQPDLNTRFILEPVQISFANLEKALLDYIQESCFEPFELKKVPAPSVVPNTTTNTLAAPVGIQSEIIPAPVIREESFANRLSSSIPDLSEICGSLFKSSEPVDLTESETEYVVKCYKHCFSKHVVFEFECINTLNEQLLENVRVQLDLPDGYVVIKEISCPKLSYNVPGYVYLLLKFPEEVSDSVGNFGATLKFVVKDCDPITGIPDSDEGYKEDYMLEDIEVTLSDQIRKLNKVNFSAAWEEIDDEEEDTYALSSMSSLEEAVQNIISFLGMQPAERSDKVTQGKSSHTLLLAGTFRNHEDVLVRAKLALGDGVTMQLTVKSNDLTVSKLISSTIG